MNVNTLLFRVGDLLFLGRTDRLRMSHVMIYIGDGMVMESAGTVGSRIFSVAEKLGVNSISDLYYECTVIDRGSAKRFYWGRVLN
jgi:cell wall-associated NlpC family hydrolase